MLRIHIKTNKKIEYKYLDILHDALVQALIQAGASSEQVTGKNALPWNFAALGKTTKQQSFAHSIVVSTPDSTLAQHLIRLKPEEIKYTRAVTIESVDFQGATMTIEPDPILPQQQMLGVLMLSPLAISDKEKTNKTWYKNIQDFNLSQAINHRLSRLANREINLNIQADSLYVRSNPDHSVLVPVKQVKGKRVFVIGMSVPLVLQGSEEDLRFAWYAGIGEKTRNGFGCIGLVERGLGR